MEASKMSTKQITRQARRLGEAAAKAKRAGDDKLVVEILNAASRQATAIQRTVDRTAAARFCQVFNRAYGAL
jgi:hypothetical protein